MLDTSIPALLRHYIACMGPAELRMLEAIAARIVAGSEAHGPISERDARVCVYFTSEGLMQI